MGVFLMPLHHHPVSSDLGDNGGSGNGSAELVPFPDGFLWQGNLDHLIPVDEDKIGRNWEGSQWPGPLPLMWPEGY